MQTKTKEEPAKPEFKELINTPTTKQIKNLYLFTTNHKTAPVVIREKFAIPDYQLKEACQSLKTAKHIDSFLILSTCNRTEIYFTSDNYKKALEEVFSFLSRQLSLEPKIIEEYSLILKETEVVNHIFKLACGLNSLVVGEKQILFQLKFAYSVAQTEKTLGSTLELLSQYAMNSAKEIHKTTTLSENSQSISSVTVELADKVCGPLKTKSIMVLGAGTMAKLALEHLLKIGGTKETIVLNKSPHRVIEFSESYKVTRAFPFEDVYNVLNDADVLICAAGAPHFILFAEQFEKLRKDIKKPLFIFDLSMPRNVDAEFGRLPNIKLYDIDSIQQSEVSLQKSNSSEEIAGVESIISTNISSFYEKLPVEGKQVQIKNLRERLEQLTETKLNKLLSSKDTFSREEAEYIARNISNTVFHELLKSIKEI